MKAIFLAGCARWLWMDKIENLGWDRQVSSLHQGSVPGGRPQGKTPKVSPLFFTSILWKKELIWLNRALFQMKICQSISLSPLMSHDQMEPPQMVERKASSKESSCCRRSRGEQDFSGGNSPWIGFDFISQRCYFWKWGKVVNLRSRPNSSHKLYIEGIKKITLRSNLMVK